MRNFKIQTTEMMQPHCMSPPLTGTCTASFLICFQDTHVSLTEFSCTEKRMTCVDGKNIVIRIKQNYSKHYILTSFL